MARIVIGIVAAAIVALAIWAAFPSTSPLAPTGQPHRIAPVVPSAGERQRGTPTSAAPAADGDLEARINACLSAQREVASARAQRGGPAPAGQPSDAAVVSRGCAPLYHEAGCRDALMRFDDPPPEKRSASVLTACAHA